MSRAHRMQPHLSIQDAEAAGAHRAAQLHYARDIGKHDAQAGVAFTPGRFHDAEVQQQYELGYGQVAA